MRVRLRYLPAFSLNLFILFSHITGTAQVIYFPHAAAELLKQRASEIHCVNNLKQILLSAQVWAMDNSDHFPPDFQTFALELGDPSLLVCPADVSYAAPTNWAALDWSRLSYEWLAQPDWLNPTNPCCRCRIHNNVAWVEGSVHQLGGYHAGWPEILAGPVGQYVVPGTDARFEIKVAEDAAAPLSFQWRRDTLYFVTNAVSEPDPDNAGQLLWFTNRIARFMVALLPDQTNQQCLLANVSTNETDFYSVAVSNSVGIAVSAEVGLQVTPNVSAMAADPSWAVNICINNLREMGLLVKWMNRDPLPDNLNEMTNRFGQPLFGWPVALHCPADTNWSPTMSWTDVDLTSYEIVPGDPLNPLAVYCRCKVHGFYLQPDGGVMWRPLLSSIVASTNSLVQLSLRTFAGRTNILEACSDLKKWERLANYGSQVGDFLYSESRQNPHKFYRIRLE
jgi:hypothetical protein